MILAMLGLIDAALVASLIVMVMISGYENFVSRFDEANDEVSFLGKLDAGSLKIKVASSIVAISSIHLLQVFLNANQYDNWKLALLTLIHIAFVVSALMLGVLEKLSKKDKARAGRKPGPLSIGGPDPRRDIRIACKRLLISGLLKIAEMSVTCGHLIRRSRTSSDFTKQNP